MTKTTLYHTPNGALAVHQSEGIGAPIVLLHGNSSSARAFSRQLEGPLGRRRRLVAIDLLGHGQSENASDPAVKAAMEKQIEAWLKTAARYDSEPDTREGRKELAARAKEAEEGRDLAMAKYHHYELASAAFQIGIVLASAAVITEVIGLAWFAGVLGVIGIVITALGLFAPHAAHHFL